MKRLARLIAMVIGLALMLNGTSSGGPASPAICSSPGCNSTLSDGDRNTAGGTGALQSVVSPGGINNTGFGFNALKQNTTGLGNTATGDEALSSNTTGLGNTATGVVALPNNTTGSLNTAIGSNTLFMNTTGHDNTATGTNALLNNTTGIKNTAVGRSALELSSGSKNIAIGYEAGVTLTAGNNNIYIGNKGASTESLTIRLGSVQARTFIAGIAAASVGNAATVEIDTTTGQLGIPLSSARYKQDIAPMGTRSEKVLQLRPVTFAYRDDAKAMTHYGLIAEEVAVVLPELVTYTATGDVQAVKYHALIPMLLNELQRQQQELAELRALVAGQLAGQRAIGAAPLITQSETDEAVR
jgi:hypothetical protein